MSATEALAVLYEIVDLLTDEVSGCPLDPPPCRAAVYPGADVPWDVCGNSCDGGDGMLYANLSTMDARQDPPCQHITFTAEVGVLRCAAGPQSDGSPPSVEDLQADADQQAADADAIREAIACCEARSEDLRGIVTVAWRALGPEGNCVGGVWVIRGIIDTCC